MAITKRTRTILEHRLRPVRKETFSNASLKVQYGSIYFLQPPPVSSRNGVIRGYFVLYKQTNKIYRGKNLTVKGGEKRSYVIGNLDPYKAYIIEIEAFTRAGVSPKGRAQEEVVTHEDGRLTAFLNHLHSDAFAD